LSIYAITGGAGFIGAALAVRLGHAGHDVRVLDDLSGAGARRRAADLVGLPHVTLIEGDVRDRDACRALCDGVDCVFHHAAPAYGADEDAACAGVIVGGTALMLAAAREAGTVRRFVSASSGDVYGDTPATSKHESGQTDPITARACALLSAEHFCRGAFHRHGLQTVCLRYFSVYGPGQDGTDDAATCLIHAAARGGAVTVRGDAGQSRDLLYIDDAVEANLRAADATRGVGGKVFNVAGGRRLPLGHLRETLERLTGRRLAVEYAPARPGDVPHLRADISAAAGLLQFTPAVGLDDGLARFLHSAE